MTKRLVLLVVAGVLAIALSGCGGSDPAEEVPSELAGTYVTTLVDEDLPANAAPELEAGRWELAIGELEGADAGSFLAIDHPTHGTLEEPGLTIDGDRPRPPTQEIHLMGESFDHRSRKRVVVKHRTHRRLL